MNVVKDYAKEIGMTLVSGFVMYTVYLAYIASDEVELEFPVCEREIYLKSEWLDDERHLVPRDKPLRFKTVCGLSGVGRDHEISASYKTYDDMDRLISKDFVLTDEVVRVSCRDEPGRNWRDSVWAETPQGLWCEFPTDLHQK